MVRKHLLRAYALRKNAKSKKLGGEKEKMETKNINYLVISLVVMMVVSALAMPASATITPGTFTATLDAGECVDVEKEVYLPGHAPRVDVIFAFDLTGSMGGIISTAKAKSGEIMTMLETDYPGVDFNYGVMSYMDYPHSYSSCGYSSQYGSTVYGDYAYSLDQSLTSDQTVVSSAITALVLGGGSDGPQDYTRIMYESYADTSVGWRTGAKKLVVNFGDNVPHDCNLNEGVTTGIWTTGGDPGRDEVMGTADDLDLQTVLANMATNNVIWLECHTSTSANAHWTYWTGITGGSVYITNSITLADDVVGAITAGISTPHVYGLHLVASAGYELWVSSVPAVYPDLTTPTTVTFTETICVPSGTAVGVYDFTVSAMDASSVSHGDQADTITVPDGERGNCCACPTGTCDGCPCTCMVADDEDDCRDNLKGIWVGADGCDIGTNVPCDEYTCEGEECIPEFSTIALPVASILGLLFFFNYRKRKREQ